MASKREAWFGKMFSGSPAMLDVRCRTLACCSAARKASLFIKPAGWCRSLQRSPAAGSFSLRNHTTRVGLYSTTAQSCAVCAANQQRSSSSLVVKAYDSLPMHPHPQRVLQAGSGRSSGRCSLAQ